MTKQLPQNASEQIKTPEYDRCRCLRIAVLLGSGNNFSLAHHVRAVVLLCTHSAVDALDFFGRAQTELDFDANTNISGGIFRLKSPSVENYKVAYNDQLFALCLTAPSMATKITKDPL